MGKELTKKYYSISEVAEILGETQPTLRVWGKNFNEVLSIFTKSNTRYYTPENIEMLRDIQFLLRKKGFTHAGALEKLKSDLFRERKQRNVMEKLAKIKDELIDIRLELNQTAAMAETVIV